MFVHLCVTCIYLYIRQNLCNKYHLAQKGSARHELAALTLENQTLRQQLGMKGPATLCRAHGFPSMTEGFEDVKKVVFQSSGPNGRLAGRFGDYFSIQQIHSLFTKSRRSIYMRASPPLRYGWSGIQLPFLLPSSTNPTTYPQPTG